jgi:ribosomal protein S18 acetylase RimI-like enzyme
MPITILPAVLDDIPTIVEIYFRAFQNPWAIYALPDIPSVRSWFITTLSEELLEPNSLFLLAFDDPESVDEINRDRSSAVGFAKWNSPSFTKQPPSIPTPTWPAGAKVAVADEFFEKLVTAHVAAMEARPHWYLEMLGTLPRAQGQGAGTALLAHGCEMADREGLEAYLEASPSGLKLYEKYGFEKVGLMEVEWEEKEGERKSSYWNASMVRRPRMGRQYICLKR